MSRSLIASVYFAHPTLDQATLVATVHVPETPAALFDVHAAITTGKLYDGADARICPRFKRSTLAARGFRYGDFVQVAGKYYYFADGEWKPADTTN